MSAGSPLDNWRFLIGEWRGESEGQFGEKGVIENVAVFSIEPSQKFIMARGEARSEGRVLNRSISLLFYDSTERKFKRKTFFSYGFVNNEVEYASGTDEIRFNITMEPLSKDFQGTHWRSYLRRISNTQIATGLEAAQGEREFKNYGETILTKAVGMREKVK